MILIGCDPGDSTAVWPMYPDGRAALDGPRVIRRDPRDSLRDFATSFSRQFNSRLEGSWKGAGKMEVVVEQYSTPPSIVTALRLALIHGAIYASAVCAGLPCHTVAARSITTWLELPSGVPRAQRKALLMQAMDRFPAARAVIQNRPAAERPHLVDAFLIAEWYRVHKLARRR